MNDIRTKQPFQIVSPDEHIQVGYQNTPSAPHPASNNVASSMPDRPDGPRSSRTTAMATRLREAAQITAGIGGMVPYGLAVAFAPEAMRAERGQARMTPRVIAEQIGLIRYDQTMTQNLAEQARAVHNPSPEANALRAQIEEALSVIQVKIDAAQKIEQKLGDTGWRPISMTVKLNLKAKTEVSQLMQESSSASMQALKALEALKKLPVPMAPFYVAQS